MTGETDANADTADAADTADGAVSDAGRQWLERWCDRLLHSVSSRLYNDPADLAEDEDVPEEAVREELRDEVSVLGSGLDRIVIEPPAFVTPDGSAATDGDEGVPFFDDDTLDSGNIAVKLPRPTEPCSDGGIGQNMAEDRVWSAVSEGDLHRFDAATADTEPIDADLFAPVIDVARDHSWLVMERCTPLREAVASEEKREDAVASMEALFLEADLRPDLSPDNIGVREDGSHLILDYGMPNWAGEDGLW